VGVQASLRASRLIPRALKLMIIYASSDPEVYETRTGDIYTANLEYN